MKVLSHRGYWKSPEERNAPVAFSRSFELGFGTETDLRDLDGALVVSHDPPRVGALGVDDLLAIYRQFDPRLALAINVKADGLAVQIRQALVDRVPDYFVFDMSIPDTRAQLKAGNPVFVRMSEHEPSPPFLDRAAGVWLDAFDGDWFGTAQIDALLSRGLRVCVVSPELHQRPHAGLWAALRPMAGREGLMLCTDLPEQARAYFEVNR